MKLYSTLSRKTEEFIPFKDGQVHFFVCGPTVYDYAHLGHAKTYVQMDTLARILRDQGYEVTYIQNITDIDDKILARANEKHITWQALRDQFETAYHDDMLALHNESVSQYARATDYIDDIILQVQTLQEKGHAYTIDDGIYFEISTFADYGKLSGRREVKENDSLARIDQSDQKRGWNDFCLWKFEKPGEPSWEAPFGKGRPGWHIEDTAISEHFFGPQYDIHGGAVDLIFPHHEAEITQMEAASGLVPFVRYWTHTGFLTIDNTKMSKSLGNFHTIRSVIEQGHDPMAIRLFMLQSHYRSAVNFNWEALEATANRLRNWRAFADLQFQLPSNGTFSFDSHLTDVTQALADDLNTPLALSVLDTAIAAADKAHEQDQLGATELKAFLQLVDNLLGLGLAERDDLSDGQKSLLAERQIARQSKAWQKSDQLRDELLQQKIGVRDTADGAIWFRL
jgi:cysteinyl-tRNA synthetase